MTNFHNFKTGDMITVLESSENRASPYWSKRIGSTCRVTGTSLRSVQTDMGTPYWASTRFAVLLPEKADQVKIGTYVIMLRQGRTLLPASNPKVYDSDAQARKVAEVMATKHGGTFLVFNATDEFAMPPQPVLHHRAL